MSHFYASIQGPRGEATRAGGKDSGISGHIRGWRSGVRVQGFVNRDGRDEFDVYATGGSGGGMTSKLIATVTINEDGEVVVQERIPA